MKRRRFRTAPAIDFDPTNGCEPLCRLWVLRILALPQVYPRLQQGGSFHDEIIWERLGMDPGPQPKDWDSNSRPPPLKTIQRALAVAEKSKPVFSGSLAANLLRLKQELGMSALECEVLGFFIILHSIEWLDAAADYLGTHLNNLMVYQALARILHQPIQSISEALGPDGTLSKAGLLRFDSMNQGSLLSRMELMGGLWHILSTEHSSPERLFSMFFKPAAPASLTLADYAHLNADVEILRDLLANASNRQMPGVNLLIYGPPGSGKTELARLVAKEAGLSLFEVSAIDQSGDPRAPAERLPVFQLCQTALAQRPQCAVLFDELEDVFPEDFDIGFIGTLSLGDKRKAWTNQVLESNPVPAIWISNRIGQIEEAFLRRFSYILELDSQSRNVRRRILTTQFQNMDVSERWLDHLADMPNLMPAHTVTALRTARITGRVTGQDAEMLMERTLSKLQEACGHRTPSQNSGSELIPYTLDYLNPDTDLAALITGLKRTPNVRICLYGPSGTGKTAFGKHLARELDRTLLVQRASDLLGMYVGQSEKNIARMFREAERQGAVLMVDEADSFLRERMGAHHSWEVTQVNEFLVGLENYAGLFIACTNIMDGLDQAVFRRFDVKIHFEVLTAPQRDALFNSVLKASGLGPLAQSSVTNIKLKALHGLTPGDFQAAIRGLRATGFLSAESLLQALERELAHKPEFRKRTVGFIR
jgi:SpoVK/Ycf46/Vps4 family AAA+-type ATPase